MLESNYIGIRNRIDKLRVEFGKSACLLGIETSNILELLLNEIRYLSSKKE